MGLSARIALAVLALVVVACGGETTDPDVSPGSSTTMEDAGSGDGGEGTVEELEAAAVTHFEAFLGRDDETYFDLLSSACRERLGFAAVGGHLDGRHFNAGFDGVDMTALEVAEVVVEGGGSEASVTLVIDGPGGDRFQEAVRAHRWVYEDGGWHMDDCADFREAQGGLEGVGMDRNDPLGYGGVADVNDWLVALTHVGPDEEALIVETGGEPAAEGAQLFTVQLGVSYNGAESSIVYGDELTFDMVNGDTVYGPDSECITPGNGLYVDPATAVGPGESVGVPYVCREVPVDHVDGLMLRVTHVPTGDQWWFRLDGT